MRNISLLKMVIFLSTMGLTEIAFANPVLDHVAAGDVAIQQTDTTTVVQQSSQKAIINWQSFNIGANKHTHFQQPTGGMALNRISPNQGASEIYGRLSATGKIILVNPAGIYFGPNARVDVAGIVASTADIKNDDFLKGNMVFTHSSQFDNAEIVNQGSIRAAEYGLVALIGNRITNEGNIEAHLGQVVLASGNKFTMDFSGDQLIHFAVEEASPNAHIENSGSIIAEGGTVMVSAKSARNVIDNVINTSGVISAKSVVEKNGEIILLGGDEGIVAVSGKLDVSGKEKNQTGGKVKVTGKYVLVDNGADVDASGDQGGGEILIGGNYHGAGSLANATETFISPNAYLRADAMTQGNGGNVIVWADATTQFYGNISATGGSEGGNGGFAEVSGKDSLNYNGYVDLSALFGERGNLLLDPKFLNVITGGSAYVDNTNNKFGNNPTGTNNIDPTSINAANANITLEAITDVTFVNSLAMTNAGRTLTVRAGRSILINANVNVSTNGGDILLNANHSSTISAANAANRDAGTGSITMSAGSSVSAGSANILFQINSLAVKGGKTFLPGGMTLYGVTANTVTAIGGSTTTLPSTLAVLSSGNQTWNLNGANSGNISLAGVNTFNFSNILNLQGGSGINTFNILNGGSLSTFPVGGLVNLGSGSQNTLNFSTLTTSTPLRTYSIFGSIIGLSETPFGPPSNPIIRATNYANIIGQGNSTIQLPTLDTNVLNIAGATSSGGGYGSFTSTGGTPEYSYNFSGFTLFGSPNGNATVTFSSTPPPIINGAAGTAIVNGVTLTFSNLILNEDSPPVVNHRPNIKNLIIFANYNSEDDSDDMLLFKYLLLRGADETYSSLQALFKDVVLEDIKLKPRLINCVQ